MNIEFGHFDKNSAYTRAWRPISLDEEKEYKWEEKGKKKNTRQGSSGREGGTLWD